jgi:hypothetical protein
MVVTSTLGRTSFFDSKKSPPYKAFRQRLILRIDAASHSRYSACDRPPACVMSCLSPREGSIGTRLVDGERAPFPGAPSRLTIASSAVGVPPLIRPYPPRHHTLLRYMPQPPQARLYQIVIGHEKIYQTARAGDLDAGIAQKFLFKSPMYMAFPILVGPTNHVVGPLTPYRAKHGTATGFQHPPREVRGCRRACERTPPSGPPPLRRRRAASCKESDMLVS